MPDLKGRVAVGVDAGANRVTANNALSNSSGVEEVTLSGAESGTSAHGHTMYTQDDDHGGGHPYHDKGNPPTGGDNTTEPSAVYSGDKGVVDSVAAAADDAHANLQPYLVVQHIIKY